MTRVHHLKIAPVFYPAVRHQLKTFEVRRFDRDFRTGDVVILREWDGERYTGAWSARVIGYILPPGSSDGLADGYGVFAMSTHNLPGKLRVVGGPVAANSATSQPPRETVPAPVPA